jgi:hypothetical protein
VHIPQLVKKNQVGVDGTGFQGGGPTVGRASTASRSCAPRCGFQHSASRGFSRHRISDNDTRGGKGKCAQRMPCKAQSSKSRSIHRDTPANGDSHLRRSPAVVPMASHDFCSKIPQKPKTENSGIGPASVTRLISFVGRQKCICRVPPCQERVRLWGADGIGKRRVFPVGLALGL